MFARMCIQYHSKVRRQSWLYMPESSFELQKTCMFEYSSLERISRKIAKAIHAYSKNSYRPSVRDMYMMCVSFLDNKKGPRKGCWSWISSLYFYMNSILWTFRGILFFALIKYVKVIITEKYDLEVYHSHHQWYS